MAAASGRSVVLWAIRLLLPQCWASPGWSEGRVYFYKCHDWHLHMERAQSSTRPATKRYPNAISCRQPYNVCIQPSARISAKTQSDCTTVMDVSMPCALKNGIGNEISCCVCHCQRSQFLRCAVRWSADKSCCSGTLHSNGMFRARLTAMANLVFQAKQVTTSQIILPRQA